MITLYNTTLCYLEKNDSYLMLHRIKKKKDINKDKWIGIGGKFEACESPFDCIKREVKEETGFTLNSAEYRGIVTFVSKTSDGKEPYYELMHLFWSNDFTAPEDDFSKLPECEEGELAWIPKNKIIELPHWESDELFLELIEKRIPFFSMKVEYFDGNMKSAVLEGK
ncbi:MAG: NUDIX domain-containing protein [Treponema sp.]|nr:NUDIX domain-containing protein [Treponema sp.]